MASLMGMSNLKIALERRYKDWLGEREALVKEATEIEAAYETLEEKRERIERLAQLTASVEVIMAEVAPKWDPAAATPTKKGQWKSPFKAAEITSMSFRILRQAEEPMRSRAIAEEILTQSGISLEDRDLLERVRVAVDATLRKHKERGTIESHDSWPVRWSIKDFGDRPSG